MATIQDMAETAAFIREGFLALATEVGSNSHPMKIMDASVNLYFNICRLEADLQDAATPSSENTPGGAAEKMPGGGSGNFDREGGLENPKEAVVTHAPGHLGVQQEYRSTNGFEVTLEADDDSLWETVTIPVTISFVEIVGRSGFLSHGESIQYRTAGQGDGDIPVVYHDIDRKDVSSFIDFALKEIRMNDRYRPFHQLWRHRQAAYQRGLDNGRTAA